MRAYLALAILLSAGGCAPSCERTCRHLLSCSEELDAEGLVLDQCKDECSRTEDLYRFWEDDVKIKALHEHRSCLVSTDCQGLADGECYDETLFPYEQY